MKIQDCTIAVTGGARGIGEAIAEAAAARGARVVIGDVAVDRAERTARRVGALAFELDVTSQASWETFVADADEQLGGIDVLVNNAGIMPIGRLLDESEESTRRQLDINVLGVLLGCKAVLGGMLERERGHLINIASMAGKLGVAGVVTYSASKFAVVGLSQALDDELRGTPVSVTRVLPGIVNTDLSQGLPSNFFTPEVDTSEVADAILGVIAKPQSELWAPSSGRLSFTVGGLIPTGPRNEIMRRLGLADPFLSADHEARAGYEERVAAPDPATLRSVDERVA